jgi:hypothetical protein
MTDRMRIVLEVGPKGRRVVAGALDWPGLDRWGKDDDAALEKLAAYVPRYAGIAERAGLAEELARQDGFEVIERYPGNTSTDFWGIAHVPSPAERESLPAAELERRLRLLRGCWSYFDDVVARIGDELRPGFRGGGRTRTQIIRHVLLNEPDQFSKKVGVRTPLDSVLEPATLEAHRVAFLDGFRTANAAGPMVGRSWTVPFLLRRTAQHVTDHAWEMEDRDPAA